MPCCFRATATFRPLVEALQRQAVRVSVVSTLRSQPPMIADELRRQADNFIELDALRDIIGRPPRERDPAPPDTSDRPSPTLIPSRASAGIFRHSLRP